MSLDLVKCLWESDKKKYYIMFIKRRKKYCFYTENISQYNEWKEQLRKLVLIADFHDEYTVTKQIGKGSFARVYYATRKGTKNEFAIKAFSKSSLQEEEKGVVVFYFSR